MSSGAATGKNDLHNFSSSLLSQLVHQIFEAATTFRVVFKHIKGRAGRRQKHHLGRFGYSVSQLHSLSKGICKQNEARRRQQPQH
ncbi:hypothetical protein EVA_17052 [gut metagenome]|uniref:Uncharacterized protein n=1 Tax=gut metagenome TaxID=749906 RepID=J9C4U5_9ZZZZ